MAAINGKWKLVSSDNFMDYVKAIGSPAESLEKAKFMEDTSAETGLVEEFSYDGSNVTRKLTALGGKMTAETTIPFGVETDAKSVDNRPIKVKLTGDGNSFTRIEKGDGYEAEWVREISGDDMTVTITTGDVKCVRKYKRI